MIETDKYKKGIIALTKRAATYNPDLGEYQKHFINDQAKFIIQLSNGRLEIGIELAREFEDGPHPLAELNLKKIAINYTASHKAGLAVDSIWKRLFHDNTANRRNDTAF